MGFLYQIFEDQDGSEAVGIAGYEGEIRRLQIPETKDGLPVRKIGSHAFAYRKDIREAWIPESVESVGSFCFYACPELERLSLHDSVTDLRDGMIRSCGKLREIRIGFRKNGFRILKEILADTMTEMDFLLVLPTGEEAVLTFPEYHNEDREDTRARAIHSRIIGAGYHYREMVSRKEIDFRGYDQLFRKAMAEESPSAGRIALNRLYRPFLLKEDARELYREYLSGHQLEIMRKLCRDGDRERISLMLREVPVSEETVAELTKLAGEKGDPELCGILMEYDRQHFAGTKGQEIFSLEDF